MWPLVAALAALACEAPDLGLPEDHLPLHFGAFPDRARACGRPPTPRTECWGYEDDCPEGSERWTPRCPGDHRGWVASKEAQLRTFRTQADFGYVAERRGEMTVLCEPTLRDDSSLECSRFMRFCRGRNLMLNFTGLVGRGDDLRYKTDVLAPGEIGGRCRLHRDRLEAEAEHTSPLQSWAPEMSNFAATAGAPLVDGLCDVVVEEPTFVVKLDAAVNMYHHFCDFLNLYASLHVNSSHPDGFSRRRNVLVWETYTYGSAFADTWKAFADGPVWDLKTFRGKVVCFKNAMFPLLPRMIFGLYYNTPIIYGCERSGLFTAFSEHVLNGLGVRRRAENDGRVRITLLSRETKYRNVINERELIAALEADDRYVVKRVVYDRRTPFTEQLSATRDSDIFIGMHGAGLTHLLFLPEWAVIFELYNCEDPACYSDLARLRGIKYVTWENKDKLFQQDQGHHPEGGSHPKFTNYAFDVEEFLRLVKVSVDHVRSHPSFVELTKNGRNSHGEL